MAKKNLPGLPDITTVDDREDKKKQNTSRKKNLPTLPKQKTWESKREKTQTLGEKLVSVAYGKDAPLGGRVSDIVDQAARDGKLTETENRQLSRIRSSQDENTYVHTLQQLLNKAKRSGDSNASLMEDQLTTVKGMQEISRLPQEDRKLLETYVALRPQAYPRAVAKQLHDKGYSNDDIERLAEIYSRHRNEQDAAQRQAEAARDAKDNPFVSNVKALVASAAGGVAGSLNALGETVHRTLTGSQYNSIDPNLPGYTGSDYASTVRGQTAQGITDKLGDGFVGRGAAAVYSGATSAADNLVRIGIGALTGGASAVTLGLAAASSFQDGVQSASRRGGNAAQALLYGTANAGLEVATEKIPLDNLFKTGTPTSWGQLFKNAGKQAGMEIVTEEANFIGGLLADAAIMAEKSEFKGTVNDLIASGMTYEEARKKAYEGLWWQAYETGISSGLSGGLMSGGASALNTVINGGFADPQQTQSQPVTPEQTQPEPEHFPAPTPDPWAVEHVPVPSDRTHQAVDTVFDAFGIDRETGEMTANQPAPPVEETVDRVETPAYNDPRAAGGASGVTYSDANTPISFRYAAVPAETLISSHDEYGNVNPNYPAELQPRDRSRAASVTQIAGMSRGLNPELLADSPTAQNGSPIVRSDGTVVSGNARTQAILTAYKNAGADGYREYIIRNAARFGIDPASVPNNPVLVRVLDSDADLETLASSLNSSTVSGYSATERAMDDASRIGDIIGHLSPEDSGTLTSASNRDFLKAFIAATPATQRADMLQPDGSISKQGIERAKYAVFAYAYGDPSLMFALSEDTDADSKNLLSALVATAPAAVSVKDGAQSGALHDVGAVSAVTNAVRLYSEVRNAGTSVEAYTAQQSMDSDFTEHEVFLAKVFEWNKRSANRIQTFLSEFYTQVRSYGDPNQTTMFSAAEPTIGGALKGATTGYEQTAGREIYPGRNADGFENAAGSRRDAAAQPLSHERDSAENFRSVPEDAATGAVITDSGEAVGAASRDYSGFESYNDLLTDDNVQRSRANDAKHEEIPIRDGNGQRVSEFASNAMNSEVISERDVNALKHLIQEGAFGHKVQHMDDVQKAAIERINEDGKEVRANAITQAIADGRVDEHTVAEAQVLFAAYTGEDGKVAEKMASTLLLQLQEMATQTARQLNMFKLLRRMTPEGRLATMRGSVNRMAQELNAGRSKNNQVAPEIPPELEAEYVNAETEAQQNAAVEKIQQAIADQLPSTLLEKWNALRYVNMLGNFKTQGRNIAGNIGMAAVTDIKNAVGAVLESLAVKAGANIERTKSVHVNKALRRKAAADFAYVEKLAMGDGKYAEWEGKGFLRGVQEKRKIFTSKNKAVDTLLKPLEAYRQATDWAMNNEYFGDTAFSRAAYAKALGGYLQANGITADTFDTADPVLMEKARTYAIKEAREATFRDDNTISDWIGKLGRKKTTPKAVRILSEGVMPFRKTPANVLVRAEEYSPLGLINAAVAAVKSKNPDSGVTGEDVINSLSKSLTGTGIFLLGMGLRNLGVLSGAEDEDENRAQFDKETGYQPYSIVLPDATYTLDWLTPAALPLFMGAQLMDLVDDGGLELKDLESALLSIADPMLEMSMLQGVNDTLDNIKYSENNLGQFAINSMVSYLTQGLTNTLMGQLERSFNADRTSTYVDKDSDIPAWIQRAVGSASQKVPGWDFQQAPYIDSTGKIEKNGSWIENLFSPGYYDKRTVTKNQEELQRIADATGITGVLTNDTARSYTVGGETINLTAQQWAKTAETEGKLAHSILAAAFQAEDYALLSDKERAAMVESVYKYAGEKARMDVLGDEAPGFSAAWMKGISGKEAETILARAVQDASGLPESGYAAAREMGFSMDEMKRISGAVKETLKGIEDSNDYDTYRAVLGAAGKAKAADWLRVYGMTESRVAAMQAAADAGISNTAYLNMAEAESGIDRAFSDITKAWRTGDDVDMAQLADAYKQFSKLPGSSKAYAAENAEGRVRAYLRARDAGVSDAAFASLYKTYYTLDGKESENATKWAAELDKAVAAKTITKAQRKVLWDSLGYYAQVRQNADTYHKIYNAGSSAGVSVGLAEELTAVISNGLNPESGKSTVRAIQKFEAIVDMPGMSARGEAAVLKAYLDEEQTERYNAMTARGYSAEEYVEAYRAYLDRDNKADGIYDIMDALGVSYAEAKTIFEIYYGR